MKAIRIHFSTYTAVVARRLSQHIRPSYPMQPRSYAYLDTARNATHYTINQTLTKYPTTNPLELYLHTHVSDTHTLQYVYRSRRTSPPATFTIVKSNAVTYIRIPRYHKRYTIISYSSKHSPYFPRLAHFDTTTFSNGINQYPSRYLRKCTYYGSVRLSIDGIQDVSVSSNTKSQTRSRRRSRYVIKMSHVFLQKNTDFRTRKIQGTGCTVYVLRYVRICICAIP